MFDWRSYAERSEGSKPFAIHPKRNTPEGIKSKKGMSFAHSKCLINRVNTDSTMSLAAILTSKELRHRQRILNRKVLGTLFINSHFFVISILLLLAWIFSKLHV